jgi:uncharacterized protein (DUF1697 family)
MARFAAFLRGMNVGGHRLTNAELRAHFEALGFAEVATFRASGNVVFAGDVRPPPAVRASIEEGLHERLGYAVPALIRSAEQMRAIAGCQPFASELISASAGKLQVGLLAEPAPPDARKRIKALAGEDDRVVFDGCELYWLPRAGVLDSQLDMQALARQLGVMTMRTKGTLELIFTKHLAG